MWSDDHGRPQRRGGPPRRGRSAPPPSRKARERRQAPHTIAPVLRAVAQHVPVVDAMNAVRLGAASRTTTIRDFGETDDSNTQKRPRRTRRKWNPQKKPEFQAPYCIMMLNNTPLEFCCADLVAGHTVLSSSKLSASRSGSRTAVETSRVESGEPQTTPDPTPGAPADNSQFSSDEPHTVVLHHRRSHRRVRSPFAPSREPERDRDRMAYAASSDRVVLSRMRDLRADPVSVADEPAPLPDPIPPLDVRTQPNPSLSNPSLSHNRSTLPFCPPPSSSLSTARRNQGSSSLSARRNGNEPRLPTQSRSNEQSRSQESRSQQTNTPPSPPENPPNIRRRRSMAMSRQASSNEVANALARFSVRRNSNEAIVWHQTDIEGHTFGYGALWRLKDL